MHIAALYESVTKSIIDDLENGVAPWTKPWKNGNTGGITERVNDFETAQCGI